MNNRFNNILSYFTKDIKDIRELVFYKQIKYNIGIKIFYKDKLIYNINYYYCYNYINNILKSNSLKYIYKSNISYYSKSNKKKLYYTKNDTLNINNPNYIKFYYLYNKYLNKIRFHYSIDSEELLFTYIIYYKNYKYIRTRNNKDIKLKFTSAQILIPNKYELDYYCKFFNLYFAYVNN
jgi:hypothetical protein